ncbi:MAG: hypothetical protein HS108_11755 [Planctomycetes bacterium]|nr:hypothetical protein [Planctomycetota bacterium]MCL4730463.1 hypothetical protein [Planctomycetota bacterium]
MPEFDGILFSDLHLSPDTTRLNEMFEAFVRRVEGTPHVACLGDLFEYWIGYMQLRQDHGRWAFDLMQRLAKPARLAVWVNGNRDFMFKQEAAKAGFDARRNLWRGDFCGVPTALEHGDRFCTLDHEYQRFRWWFRRIPWRALQWFISEKRGHEIARGLRRRSKGQIVRRNPSQFGIQREPVERLMARGARVVVCGHVHSPFARSFAPHKDPCRLLVMGDWRADGAVVCTVKDGVFRLARFNGSDFEPFEAPTEQQVFAPGM